MVLSAAAAAAAASGAAGVAGGSLFQYNRKNYMYDRKMRLETEFNIMEFRIKQAELWREDVRDIIGLTSVKMGTYLIVNAVQLGFCVMAFCEGRLAAGTPPWLIGCHTLSLTGAFMFLLMSVWLAMHASVAAKSYEVRLLTQLVRLPVPSWAQLEGARTYASTYERLEARQMFRVPFVMGLQESVLSSSERVAGSRDVGSGTSASSLSTATLEVTGDHVAAGIVHNQDGGLSTCTRPSADPWGLESWGDHIYELDGTVRVDLRTLQHIQLVRAAMAYWQSYDGFARASMSIGTNQLVTALSYYVIGYVLVSNHAVIAAYLGVILFMAIAIAIIRLDMSLTVNEFRVTILLVVLGPACICASAKLWMHQSRLGMEVVGFLVPFAYATHAAWMVMVLHVSKVHEQVAGVWLPTGFRSVLYIDVFGWIKRNLTKRGRWWEFATASLPTADLPANVVPGNGPAIQAVRYQSGRPIPQRPENLPGASVPARLASHVAEEEFEPSTFVPRQRGQHSPAEEVEECEKKKTSYNKAGSGPWRVFCGATLLLFALWVVSGAIVTLQVWGIDSIDVVHNLRGEPEVKVQKSINSHQEQLVQNIQPIGPGKPILTNWPSANIHAHSLACDGSGIVSSTRFGLFAGRLTVGEPRRLGLGNGSEHLAPLQDVRFEAVPVCEDIEGESLQDVGLLCDGVNKDFMLASCQALVLHRQGQRLHMCNIAITERGGRLDLNEDDDGRRRSAALASRSLSSTDLDAVSEEGTAHVSPRSLVQMSTSLRGTWLDEPDGEGKLSESVVAIAPTLRCNGPATSGANVTAARACAHVGTTAGRIVEIEDSMTAGGLASGIREWVPSRLLREAGGTVPTTRQGGVVGGGTLHGILGRYLGVLRPDIEHLAVLDPGKGGDVVGTWSVPSGQGWQAMCATGDYLYLLAKGPSPQLWRFEVPAALQASLSAP